MAGNAITPSVFRFLRAITFTEKRACAASFASELAKVGQRAGLLMKFLADAVSVRW